MASSPGKGTTFTHIGFLFHTVTPRWAFPMRPQRPLATTTSRPAPLANLCWTGAMKPSSNMLL
eukprot:10361385-Alexandrium_andersonii.AAC.1